MRKIIAIASLVVLCSLARGASVSLQKLASGELSMANPASIEGQVTRAGSQEPLSDVLVTFTPEAGSPKTVATTDDGKFAVRDMAAGRYAISMSRAGYFRARPGGPVNLALAAGDKLEGIQLQMWAAAAISGRVTDQDGRPLKSAVMSIVCRYYEGGHRMLTFCGGNRDRSVDASGAYRMDDLEPGEYYLAASTPGFGSMEIGYYPGVGDPSSAISIVLAPGMEATGTDFKVPRQDRHVVSFKLLEPQAESAGARKDESLQIRRHGDGMTMRFPGTVNKGTTSLLESIGEGNYRLRQRLSPGSYELDYVRFPGLFGTNVTGRLSFNVKDEDLYAGTMVLKPGVTIYGRLDGTDALPPDWEKEFSLRLVPVDGRGLPKPTAGLDADGKFVVGMSLRTPSGEKKVTPTPVGYGRYQVELRRGVSNDMEALNKQGLCLTEVMYGGLSVLDGGFVVDGEPTGPLVLTVGRGGTVEGLVADSRDHPVADGRVVLIPPPDRRGGPNLFRSAATDQFGRFSIPGVVPGEYGVLAWQEIEQGAWMNPEFLAEVAGRAVKITVQSGLRTGADVHVIRGSN